MEKVKIMDAARLFGDLRPCGHTDELGNPACPNQGRYVLFVDNVLIKSRCRKHIAELREETS